MGMFALPSDSTIGAIRPEIAINALGEILAGG
jgi:hypothetical protein